MDSYQQFTVDFYKYSGIDLQSYKRPQMERRLTALWTRHGYSSFQEYLQALQKNPRLLDEMLDKMTINVSEFLRNKDRWEALVPHLTELGGGTIHAWSAACSTGEEPYTLSLLMEERVRRPFHILATDIDKRVLAQASVGEYRAHQLREMPSEWLQKYFTASNNTWSVKPVLKQFVEFKHHNLLSDAYPTSLDLIICRNVLIYFTDEAKSSIVSGFSKALKPGGLLFVGSTEQFLHSNTEGLRNIAPFLYQKVK